jgi:hypothetical protein
MKFTHTALRTVLTNNGSFWMQAHVPTFKDGRLLDTNLRPMKNCQKQLIKHKSFSKTLFLVYHHRTNANDIHSLQLEHPFSPTGDSTIISVKFQLNPHQNCMINSLKLDFIELNFRLNSPCYPDQLADSSTARQSPTYKSNSLRRDSAITLDRHFLWRQSQI